MHTFMIFYIFLIKNVSEVAFLIPFLWITGLVNKNLVEHYENLDFI